MDEFFVICERALTMDVRDSEEAEKLLQSDPDNVDLRAALIAYYGQHRTEDSSLDKGRVYHVLWMIEHHPEHSVLCRPRVWADIDHEKYPDEYHQAVLLYMQHTKSSQASTQTLLNASDLLSKTNLGSAICLAQRADSREANNEEVAWSLATLFHQATVEKGKVGDTDSVHSAIKYYEKCRSLSTNVDLQITCLSAIAQLYCLLKDGESAYGYLAQLSAAIQSIGSYDDSPLPSQLYFTLKGILDLRNDKVCSASDCLHALCQLLIGATATPGFIPITDLPQAMLDANEIEPVLEYLTCYKEYNDSRVVDQCMALIRNGERPDLRQHLRE